VAGNRHDDGKRYGKGEPHLVRRSRHDVKANIEFMESGDRRYIIGASKGTLRKFERQLLDDDWRVIRDGLEVNCAFARRRQRNVHPLSQSRSPRKRKGDARAFRATHRRGLEKSVPVAKSESGRRK
jgi:hypothetical protein